MCSELVLAFTKLLYIIVKGRVIWDPTPGAGFYRCVEDILVALNCVSGILSDCILFTHSLFQMSILLIWYPITRIPLNIINKTITFEKKYVYMWNEKDYLYVINLKNMTRPKLELGKIFPAAKFRTKPKLNVNSRWNTRYKAGQLCKWVSSKNEEEQLLPYRVNFKLGEKCDDFSLICIYKYNFMLQVKL